MTTPLQTDDHAASPADAALRARLYAALRGRAEPLLVCGDRVIPGASLWSGARLWCNAFRRMGLTRGDRVILALPPSPTFVMALVAAMWEGLSLAVALPTRSDQEADALTEDLDARAIIAEHGTHRVECDRHGEPTPLLDPRRPRHAPEPDVRLLLRTGGTTGPGRWVAITAAGLWNGLESHSARLALDGATVLSALPWHHAFGLVIDLLPALLSASVILRDPAAGRDPSSLADACTLHGVTHLSMVPLQVARLAALPGGLGILSSLEGGVIGGAPIRGDVLHVLRRTRLRVGYGQTEASPGVCLGEPGEWPEDGFMGRPLACEARVGDDGVLETRGLNVCAGYWTPTGLLREPEGRWLRTGDVARTRPDGSFVFEGRADASFKLSNGRMVHAAVVEAAIRRGVPDCGEAVVVPGRVGGLIAVLVLTRSLRSSDRHAVAEALGGCAGQLEAITVLDPSGLPRTPKGDADRLAVVADLSAHARRDAEVRRREVA